MYPSLALGILHAGSTTGDLTLELGGLDQDRCHSSTSEDVPDIFDVGATSAGACPLIVGFGF